jgi:hypothetical protein
MRALHLPTLAVAVVVVNEALRGLGAAVAPEGETTEQTATHGHSMSAMRLPSLICLRGPERHESRKAHPQNDMATT